jgi:hypothetical protein
MTSNCSRTVSRWKSWVEVNIPDADDAPAWLR